MRRRSDSELEKKYTAALRAHLSGRGEAALKKGYELGRQALADGFGVLDMVDLNYRCLEKVLPELWERQEPAELLRKAGQFSAESMSPFEMTHRSFSDANNALRRLNEILEEEIKRIAHAFHDESSQLFVTAHMALHEAARQLPDSSREHLQKIGDHLDQVVEQIRRLSHELRPAVLDDLGLLPALEFLATGVSGRTGLRVKMDGSRLGRLPTRIETALYRIVQEALNNVCKHAHASSVQIRVRQSRGFLSCSVRDDGIGFDAAAVMAGRNGGGLGLRGIRERVQALGGSLKIQPAPHGGTKLQVQVPLEV